MDAQQLVRAAEIYAEVRGITMATLGTYLTRDANFFERLAAGRVTIRRAELVFQRLSNRWPRHLPWPSDTPRPEPKPEANAGDAT